MSTRDPAKEASANKQGHQPSPFYAAYDESAGAQQRHPKRRQLIQIHLQLKIVHFSSSLLFRIRQQLQKSQSDKYEPNLDPSMTIFHAYTANVYRGLQAHWDFLPKFLSLHYYTTLEGVLGVQRSGQTQGTMICLFGPLFFSQNGMTFKKATKIIKIH